ncbi:N-acetyltransferase [Alginatibacterium sediminis]|uniref:N-acetyltransferase n=1 Tax=Alginatibacterium sediminis TaxID=2164068 RepID=A0A420EHL1_9ALTE|nr:GNAT family N-acetyltransferase [Alginatibacterium sediminis]RKF20150.1 N-acetyltransferase [Alginatibacterium sediminis]
MIAADTQTSAKISLEIRPTHSLELYQFCEVLMNAADRFEGKDDVQWECDQITPHHLLARHRLDELILAFSGKIAVAAMILKEQNPSLPYNFDDGDKALYIEKLSVHSDYASTGISQQMVDYAMLKAQRSGANLLHLVCNGRGKSLCSTLNRLGFVAVEHFKSSEASHRYFRLSL